MPLTRPQDVAVRRLRVRDRRADSLATRLSTERELAQVELRPRGLPPGAILLVRSLRARIADAPAALDDLLRTAARPARGHVPASAAAVLFASHAELLACLADDACRGIVRERWWWSLVSPAAAPAGVAAAWLAEPEAVPAAFAQLAAEGRAVAFAATLDDDEATLLTVAVARVHGIDLEPHGPNPHVASPRAEQRVLLDVVPEAGHVALTPPQATLVRLALGLARAPARLRRAHAAERPPESAGAPRRHAAARGVDGVTPPERASTSAPARATTAPSVETTPSASVPLVEATHTVDGRRAAVAPRSVRTTREPAPAEEEPSHPEPPPTAEAVPERPAARPVEQPREQRAAAGPWAPPVATALGGLFFLLVVAQRVGLYADFTEPLRPGLAADPWRFVARAGAAFLPDPDAHADDPLWGILDELARDDGEDPGALDDAIAAVRRWLTEHVDLEVQAVLERDALVFVEELRVDVVFALATHPIELRLSGIDIDPGWIPATGRALHFHFE